MALIRGRGYAIPEDVKEIAADVLRHRLIPTYEAEAEEISSDNLVGQLLDRVEVPCLAVLHVAPHWRDGFGLHYPPIHKRGAQNRLLPTDFFRILGH